jgi:hypothetical protein
MKIYLSEAADFLNLHAPALQSRPGRHKILLVKISFTSELLGSGGAIMRGAAARVCGEAVP